MKFRVQFIQYQWEWFLLADACTLDMIDFCLLLKNLYPKYVDAQNCIKKFLEFFFCIYLGKLSLLRGQFSSTALVQKVSITNAVPENLTQNRDNFLK